MQKLYGILVEFDLATPSTPEFEEIPRSAGFEPDDCDGILNPEQRTARFTVLEGAWDDRARSRLLSHCARQGPPGTRPSWRLTKRASFRPRSPYSRS